MAARGLRSVILIGGGEPTVYPGFVAFARFLKDLGLQVAVVSNGSRNDRILEVADRLDEHDWIRLSLDAGTDATFQRDAQAEEAGHARRDLRRGSRAIKARNPQPRIGFSFIITWEGAAREAGAPIVENLDEIPLAARLARDAGFDYVSFKPFLDARRRRRRGDGRSTAPRGRLDPVVARIRARVDEAKALATPTFRVVESTNLRVLESGTWRELDRASRSTCHMQALRQVLSPLGLYNCPAHRGVEKAKIARARTPTPAPRRVARDRRRDRRDPRPLRRRARVPRGHVPLPRRQLVARARRRGPSASTRRRRRAETADWFL